MQFCSGFLIGMMAPRTQVHELRYLSRLHGHALPCSKTGIMQCATGAVCRASRIWEYCGARYGQTIAPSMQKLAAVAIMTLPLAWRDELPTLGHQAAAAGTIEADEHSHVASVRGLRG
ncbi:hypothetical protein PMIN03_012683 [Paraphaeosphaeria minitans]